MDGNNNNSLEHIHTASVWVNDTTSAVGLDLAPLLRFDFLLYLSRSFGGDETAFILDNSS